MVASAERPSPFRLLIATGNPHKYREIQDILAQPGLELVSTGNLCGLPAVEEDGDTFDANARKKAIVLAGASGLWALADDSGLEVDALGGEPGVFSARYAGEPPDYQANNVKLLRELGQSTNRRAQFRCVMALADPLGNCRTVEGACIGLIAESPRGDEGFGYDPLFVPEGHDLTFAEMAGTAKNLISHRAVALAAARKAWEGTIRAGAWV